MIQEQRARQQTPSPPLRLVHRAEVRRPTRAAWAAVGFGLAALAAGTAGKRDLRVYLTARLERGGDLYAWVLDPAGNLVWTWVDASFNVDAGNNDEFMASLLPEAIDSFDYAFRYSTTNGRDWVYADLDGIGNG